MVEEQEDRCRRVGIPSGIDEEKKVRSDGAPGGQVVPRGVLPGPERREWVTTTKERDTEPSTVRGFTGR